MYKVRCSKLATLIGDCGKVNNQYKWTQLEKMNESHIKLAIEIYNRANKLFIPADVCDLDMGAGKEHEPEAIKMYDKFKGTNYYPAYLDSRSVLGDFEKENEFITGTRDFGDLIKTLDQKISTDKNVFDLKKFNPVKTEHVIQINGYGWLYGTEDNYIVNTLMPATIEQLRKFVNNKVFTENITSEMQDAYDAFLTASYDYWDLPLEKRISERKVPIIEDFPKLVQTRVEVLNDWIDKNKKWF